MDKEKARSVIGDIILGVAFVLVIYMVINYDFVPKNSNQPSPASTATAQEEAPGEPEIIGPPEFQAEVKEAIAVMKEKAPNHYKCLCSLVEKIELTSDDPPTEKSFAWTDSKEPVIYFNSKRYQEHLKYRNDASIRGGKYIIPILLAHETAHRIQFEYYQVTDARELESQALAAERDLLKKLGLSQETVNQFSGEHLLKEKWWD